MTGVSSCCSLTLHVTVLCQSPRTQVSLLDSCGNCRTISQHLIFRCSFHSSCKVRRGNFTIGRRVNWSTVFSFIWLLRQNRHCQGSLWGPITEDPTKFSLSVCSGLKSQRKSSLQVTPPYLTHFHMPAGLNSIINRQG